MTKPDWLPVLRRAAAVVTDGGGVTCHAAIVTRYLGIPCEVGTRPASTTLHDGEVVTVDANHIVNDGTSCGHGRGLQCDARADSVISEPYTPSSPRATCTPASATFGAAGCVAWSSSTVRT